MNRNSCRIAVVAPYCSQTSSNWYSPGRERKLNQLESIFICMGISWVRFITFPNKATAGAGEANTNDIQSIFLCKSNHWFIRILEIIFSSLCLRFGTKSLGQPSHLWLYNVRVPETLVAIIFLLTARKRVKLILQIEDLPYARVHRSVIRNWLDILCLRFLTHQAAAVCCVSNQVRNSFRRITRYPLERVKVFPPQLSDNFIQKTKRRKEPFSKDEIIIMYAGGYDAEKGIEDLIEAIEKITNDSLVLRLYGPVTDAIRMRLKKIDRVAIAGVVSTEELLQAYCDADIVVNPHLPIKNSTHIFPFKTIEILGCGALPFITRMPGLEEFDIPQECFFEGASELSAKLSGAKHIWSSIKDRISQLSAGVQCAYSLDSGVATVESIINV